jgi:hypothetical protein
MRSGTSVVRGTNERDKFTVGVLRLGGSEQEVTVRVRYPDPSQRA